MVTDTIDSWLPAGRWCHHLVSICLACLYLVPSLIMPWNCRVQIIVFPSGEATGVRAWEMGVGRWVEERARQRRNRFGCDGFRGQSRSRCLRRCAGAVRSIPKLQLDSEMIWSANNCGGAYICLWAKLCSRVFFTV